MRHGLDGHGAARATRYWLVLALAAGVLGHGILAAGQSKSPSRIERLQTWFAASERHEPGKADGLVAMFDVWRPEDFEWLSVDVNVVLALMDDPRLSVFFRTVEGRSTPVQALYSRAELAQLRAIAKTAAERTGEDSSILPAERVLRNKNRILKRGALLHTDAALVRRHGRVAAASVAPLAASCHSRVAPVRARCGRLVPRRLPP